MKHSKILAKPRHLTSLASSQSKTFSLITQGHQTDLTRVCFFFLGGFSFYPSVNTDVTFASANLLEHCNSPEMASASPFAN